MEKPITVKDLAEELGMSRSPLHRTIKALGLETIRVRSHGTRGQAAHALSPEDAKIVRKHYAWRLET